MRFQRPGPEDTERPVLLDEHGRTFDLSPITPDIDGAFLSDNGIAATLGPWLVTPDEVGDPQDLDLRLWVNGGEMEIDRAEL
jgi:hypothetical protein